ncbi:hypothetical protein F4779DRAFT_581616 [Xylariaceae sp. FL0662B]|nr:hypothetical protein F4779DRAFT_581616 [Xylariaceae sp. FL0662B]
MRDDRTHPLLAQIPLTVSPFVTLPTAATLPYTYKSMPSALPPPATGITGAGDEKPKYVVSPSGHAAHPDDIAASCRALQTYVARLQDDAERDLKDLEDRIRARELAEKRRVAPGWLDSDARLLQPERRPDPADAAAATATYGIAEMSIASDHRHSVSEMAVDQGVELDRAFGGMR